MNLSPAWSSSRGRDPRPALPAQHGQAAGDDLAGLRHDLDLLGRLADDHRTPNFRLASVARIWSLTFWGSRSSVDPPQHALALVVVDQRLCLLVVLLQAVLDDLGLVVVALDQAAAVHVAAFRVLRRVELHVEVVLALDAHAAPRKPVDDRVLVHVDQQRRRQRTTALRRAPSSSASAWPPVRGNPSRMKPLLVSCFSR